jgi:hypothetical protein
MKNPYHPPFENAAYASDLDTLLHPAQAFNHPDDVVRDPDLTLNEKRAILASWASDACAVEAAPALRCAPGARPVSIDQILEALGALDKQANEQRIDSARYRRIVRRGRIDALRPPKGRDPSGHDPSH